MSGYNYDCDYKNYDYNDCYKPRRRRHHKKQYNDCWEYNRGW